MSRGKPLYWFMNWKDMMTPLVLTAITIVFLILYSILAVLQNRFSDQTIAERYDAFLISPTARKIKKQYKSSEKWD